MKQLMQYLGSEDAKFIGAPVSLLSGLKLLVDVHARVVFAGAQQRYLLGRFSRT